MQKQQPNIDRDKIREELRELGLRATPSRVAVLVALRATPRPLSHSEVVERVGVDEFDRATVFRNLVKFVEVKLARVTSHAGGVARYEALLADAGEHLHAHFSCTKCGTLTCLHGTDLPLPADPTWRKAMQKAEVHVLGVCPSCNDE